MSGRYNVKQKNLEENIGENIHDLWIDKEFLDMTLKAWSVKEKVFNKLDQN